MSKLIISVILVVFWVTLPAVLSFVHYTNYVNTVNNDEDASINIDEGIVNDKPTGLFSSGSYLDILFKILSFRIVDNNVIINIITTGLFYLSILVIYLLIRGD